MVKLPVYSDVIGPSIWYDCVHRCLVLFGYCKFGCNTCVDNTVCNIFEAGSSFGEKLCKLLYAHVLHMMYSRMIVHLVL